MRRALAAEWTKVRTVRSTVWLLLAVVVLTVALGIGVVASVPCESGRCGQDQVTLSLSGVVLSQVVVAVLAVLMIGGEYATGMIRSSLAAVPRRSTLFAAKASLLAVAVVAAGAVAVGGSLVAGRLLLPGNGYTEAHGYAPLSLADGSTLRAAIGTTLYLALVALLSLGVATAVREPAVATGLVLGLLFLFPLLIHAVPDEDWQERLLKIAPMPAGLAIQGTTNLEDLPIGPWPGLGVLALWAAAAIVSGAVSLNVRDA